MNTKQILIDTRALIARPYGWTKGVLQRYSEKSPDNQSYCLMGALNKAEKTEGVCGYGTTVPYSEAELVLTRLVREKNSAFLGIVGFNDHPSTKKRDVLALLDKAIETVDHD